MAVVDRIPWGFVLILCVALGLAPFFEEPHLVEKIRLLVRGDLRRAIDWFDLLWHSWRFAILAAKLARLRTVDAET